MMKQTDPLLKVIKPDTSHFSFNFEPFLRREFHFGLDPDRPICQSYAQGHCPRGDDCPDKHVSSNFSNKIVCKHWLRGLCKKGDHCEFLHEYNLRKMPECQFFSKNGYCTTPDCQYQHIDPLSKIPPCPKYDQGFCPDGPNCEKRHVRKEFCPLYLTGFCPYGPDCQLGVHPKWKALTEDMKIKPKQQNETSNTVSIPPPIAV